ncbi:Glutamine-dependent NAD(+) synthetase (NAD(+) synthase [glutamine-hydrolyzing]) (NAD(+) synthetase) [Durusdinium trenchii]|uniref:NAD(+) synthase [glutamine-hydrolyzing] n=1 Tax=Durusdinium trenchii TaxID=1381693 RepID=A0ABP0MF01_9DINO
MADILRSDVTDDILCDIGMPVMHRNVPYNCRVWVVNRKIVGIRPKIYLANDGNYREMRWFTPWYIDPSKAGFGELEEYFLPREIGEITGQAKVPFGVFAVSTKDTCLATETCEELFTPDAPHIKLALDGVEIIANGSGSHHQLRKLDKRIDLVRGATSKSGGVMRLKWLLLGATRTPVATVNLNDVRSMRSNFIARSFQASSTPTVQRVEVDFCCCHAEPLTIAESQPIEPKIVGPMEEIAYGPSAWQFGPTAAAAAAVVRAGDSPRGLWDYLRRSGQRGYFLPLSGGADSSSTAAQPGSFVPDTSTDIIIHHDQKTTSFHSSHSVDPPNKSGMKCQRVFQELTEGTERSKKAVLADIRKVTKRPFYTPASWQDLCGKIFVTCYMASEHSGSETRNRAANLAKQIGANHTSIAIRPITDAIVKVFQQCNFEGTKIDKSKVKSDAVWNASGTEDIALQNIQARSRMVMAYFMAQLMPWATDQAMQGDAGPGWGSLLVLGSANVDEALRGYYTKYDCSAADVNPIGGINKRDLKAFLKWAAKERGIGELERVANAVPTAELRPDKVLGSNVHPVRCHGGSFYAKENERAEVLSSPAIALLMSIIRDQRTSQVEFVRTADRLMSILAEEGIARLPSVKPQVLQSPCGPYNGLAVPDGHQLCAVDIVRSGGILLEAVRKVLPELKTAKILIQRDEETALPQLFYSKLPDGIEKLQVMLCDPMLGTGGSALCAIDVLKKAGVKEENILFINVVSCPEGLKALAQRAPKVKIVTCALDSHLNEKFFIVPGVGDFGDRYYGTSGYAEGLWGQNGR